MGLSVIPFSAIATQDVDLNRKIVSPWARDYVSAAYDAGLVSPSFDLGEDYTAYITRLQLARLMVEFIAAEQNRDVSELADAYGLTLQTGTQSNAAGGSILSNSFETRVAALTMPDEQQTPSVASGSFLDTNYLYAELASKMNIMFGYAGFFRPDDNLTRAEAAVVLQRCMEALDVTEASTAPMRFSDSFEIPRWAVQAVKFASGRTDSSGTALMGGDAGRFMPLGHFTIEQAIVTLVRMHDSMRVQDVYPDWRDAPGYDQVQIDLTFGGDCTFGRGKDFSYYRSFDEMYDLMGPAYFFSDIDAFYDDDLTMVNFEGTLTTSTSSLSKTFVFRGRPEYAEILEYGSVDVVTVANNHSMDYLAQGYQDTLDNLSPYVAVSGYDQLPIVTVKGVKIGFASNVGWSFDSAQKTFIDNAVETLKAQGAEFIVFNFHWGIEGTYHSSSTQQAIAHYCIDQGADLVIGHHPHVAQEVETYKGKQIAYSLGNLVFGGNQNPADKNCLIFRQTLIFDLETRTIIEQTHDAMPYRISSVDYRNDYHPIPAA